MLNELTSIYNNPPAGYHFLVVFNYDFKSILLQPVSFGPPVPFIPLPHDSLFQDVSRKAIAIVLATSDRI